MDQNIKESVLTKEGVRLKLVGRGNSEIKAEAERAIGMLRFYKVTRGQIMENLNGSSPYMDYYLTEDDVKKIENYYSRN